jgi:hypothetical protein
MLVISMNSDVVTQKIQFQVPITDVQLLSGTLLITQIQEDEQEGVIVQMQKEFFEAISLRQKEALNPKMKKEGLSLGILPATFIKPENLKYQLRIKSLKNIKVSASSLHFETDFKQETPLFLKATGQSSVESKEISCKDLTIECYNRANITIERLKCDELKVASNGSGTILFKGGEVNNQIISISESGQIQSSQLGAINGRVEITTGNGNAEVNVSEQLIAQVSMQESVVNVERLK